jgi:hypothetical protein
MARRPEPASDSFAFSHYRIKTFARNGKVSARAFIGEKPTQVTAEAKTVEDAVKGVEQQLAARDDTRRNARKDGIPTAEEYADAFAALDARIKKNQWAMLHAHYGAPDHTMTAGELAQAAGYKEYATANMQYGALAHMLADYLGYEPPRRGDGSEIWTMALATGVDPSDDDDTTWRWKLRQEVVDCLRGLNTGLPHGVVRTA